MTTELFLSRTGFGVLVRDTMRLVACRVQTTGWVDTKVDITSGTAWPPSDLLRGSETVYGWIQGRALESIARHIHFLCGTDDADGRMLASSLTAVLEALLAKCSSVCAGVGRGKLLFAMNLDGVPVQLASFDTSGSPCFAHRPILSQASASYTDLFFARGQLAAALLLNKDDAAQAARVFLLSLADMIFAGDFASDQQGVPSSSASSTPPPPSVVVSSHAPFMLVTGAAAAWLELEDSEAAFLMGARAALHVLRTHVNSACAVAGGPASLRWPDLPPHALVECVTVAEGVPWTDSAARVLCDPGHSIEWVGLTAKFLYAATERGRMTQPVGVAASTCDLARELASSLAHQLPGVLFGAWALGFRSGPGGVAKAVDLAARRDINSDMPWWSLPEAMRAAAFVRALVRCPWWRWGGGGDDAGVAAILAGATRISEEAAAACKLYERTVPVETQPGEPAVPLRLLVQTRDAAGNVLGAIPATPDLDPGYHAGLCFLDCERLELEEAQQAGSGPSGGRESGDLVLK